MKRGLTQAKGLTNRALFALTVAPAQMSGFLGNIEGGEQNNSQHDYRQQARDTSNDPFGL